MNNKANILIADDHALVLDGLKLMLDKQKHLTVAAEATSGKEVLELLLLHPIDLVITDLSMPGLKGIDLIREIKQQFPVVRLIVLTMHNEEEIISEIMYAEAEGYVLKNSDKSVLLKAINEVLAGRAHYDEEVIDLFLKKVKKERKTQTAQALTERETQVLRLILQELTSKEIADTLFISKQTVDKHRLHIMEKTGVKTLVGLIKYAIAQGVM